MTLIDWQEVARFSIPPLRMQVLEAVEAADGGALSPKQLAGRLDVAPRQIEHQLEKLRSKGLVPPPAKLPTPERFWLLVDRRGSSECWPWRGPLKANGYGAFSVRPAPVYAHRYAYELLVGLIPEGLWLDHICHTHDKSCLGASECPHRRCVNPAHLEPVTPWENTDRGRVAEVQRERHRSRTHCHRGHELSGDNVRHVEIDGHPHRKCRTCLREKARRERAADRESVPSEAA